MKRRLFTLSFLAICYTFSSLQGQVEGTIKLKNPSFEDYPRVSSAPSGWLDCGFPGETEPDVQPSPNNEFKVSKMANHGYTYLGMVVRDNDTWESVGQKLSEPLKKGTCYRFTIDLARSNSYISQTKTTGQDANYNTPAKLRIYGGFGYCDKKILLGESSLVINYNWKEYIFKFEPVDDYSYIILEAFYQTPTLFPYNGNILLDNASDIVPIPCDEENLGIVETPEEDPITLNQNDPKPKEEVKPPVQQKIPDTPRPIVPAPKETVQPVVPEPKPKKKDPIVFQGKELGELKEGTTIRVDKLFFDANESTITKESFPTLNEIYSFLNDNKEVVVEIGGHTNNLPPPDVCDKLSQERADEVAKYLASKGISRNRLQTRGYGRREPIADNTTRQGRQQNQRVEIKILSIN
ncbi:MAG: OmpA family protein [Saprospiraceae bacterium]